MRTRCLRRAPHHRIAGLFPKKHETDDDRAGVARERPGAGRVGWILSIVISHPSRIRLAVGKYGYDPRFYSGRPTARPPEFRKLPPEEKEI